MDPLHDERASQGVASYRGQAGVHRVACDPSRTADGIRGRLAMISLEASLEGGARRAIDFHEGDEIEERTFEAFVGAAVALNTSARTAREPFARGGNQSAPQDCLKSGARRLQTALARHYRPCFEQRLTHRNAFEGGAFLKPGFRRRLPPQRLALWVIQRPADRLVIGVDGEIVGCEQLDAVALRIAHVEE